MLNFGRIPIFSAPMDYDESDKFIDYTHVSKRLVQSIRQEHSPERVMPKGEIHENH